MGRYVAAAALLASACAGPAYVAGQRTPGPTPTNLRHDEARFDAKDGTSLFTQSWRPAGEAKAALVIVHGLKDHSSRYAGAATQLAEAGIAVYAADLRGHGDSAGRRVYVGSFDDYLDDLGLLLDRVRAAEPGKPLFLFGHSLGGAIAALFALERKPELRGLILSAPALSADVSGVTRLSTSALSAVAPRLAVFSLDTAAFSRDSLVVALIEADPIIDQGKGPARTAAELLSAMDRIAPRAAELKMPLLVLHGSADRVTSPAASRDFVEHAGAADKQLKLYPDLWHDLLHEPERAAVLADVRAFIEARARGGP